MSGPDFLDGRVELRRVSGQSQSSALGPGHMLGATIPLRLQ
jgi:hypothetical protein